MPTYALLGEEVVAGLNQDFVSREFCSIRGTGADRGKDLTGSFVSLCPFVETNLAPNLNQEEREQMPFGTHFTPEQVYAGRSET